MGKIPGRFVLVALRKRDGTGAYGLIGPIWGLVFRYLMLTPCARPGRTRHGGNWPMV